MDILTPFSRSRSLNNIPILKIKEFLKEIESSQDDPKIKMLKTMAVNRYAESNIPVEYWKLKMEKHFVGEQILKDIYDNYTKDLRSSYVNGTSFCLSGNHGVGKSMTCTCILKKAAESNFNVLYTTLSDAVTTLLSAPDDDRFIARRELTTCDFLVIDEFDPRFFPSDNASALYARTLETIFRSRIQNKLPTIMCTNSPNVLESFSGSMKQSLDSLFKGYLKIIPIIGKDFRKQPK